MKRILLIGLGCALNLFTVQAQVPVIHSIDKVYASVNDIVTITGINFGNDASRLKVFFGGVTGEIISVNESLIKVKVPAGTSYDNITVSNTVNGTTAFSSEPFYISYGGKNLNASHFSDRQDFAEEDELYDLCHCDFDGDGLNDVVTTNNSDKSRFTSVTLFKNNSTPEGISLQRLFQSVLNISRETRNVTCGDLNGDGKPDLIVSQGGNAAERIYAFKNISSKPGVIEFDKKVEILSLSDGGPTNGARRLAIHDLDGDGKPEIIVTNQTVSNAVIFGNASTTSNIFFPINKIQRLKLPSNTLGLAVKDLNNDGKPEIIVNNNLADNIYYLENTSSLGNISFSTPTTLAVPGLLINLVAGDLDGDRKIDLAVVKFNSGNVSVLLNQSVGKKIAFSAPQNFIVSQNPWGIDMGDINGDGKLDIAITSLNDKDKITLLLNNSSPGTINFQSLKVGGNEINRNIKIADMNGDAKPDLTFTTLNNAGNFSITTLRNTGCIFPQIIPAVPEAICDGTPIELNTYSALFVDYQWQMDGTDIPKGIQQNLEVATGGTYTVEVSSTIDGCKEKSNPVNVEESTDIMPETPTINNKGVYCEGDDLQLEPTKIINEASYVWTGPNGFSQTGAKLFISNITMNMAGEYFLDVKTSACQSVKASTLVSISSLPSVSFSGSKTITICEGATHELTVPQDNKVTYQWYRNGSVLPGKVQNTLVVSQSGSFSIKLMNSNSCYFESEAVKVELIEIPKADFTITQDNYCVDDEISFKNESSGATKQDLVYAWNFDDGTQSSEKDPVHAYNQTGDYTVTLFIQYHDYNCSQTTQKTLSVSALPSVNIIASNDKICPGDSSELSLSESFETLVWSNGSEEQSTYVKKEGMYEVTVTNSLGCVNKASTEIFMEALPQLKVSAARSEISLGESVQLEASGAAIYTWEPAESLNEASIANPIAFPESSTIYKVTGTVATGCISTAEIEILVNRELNIEPRNAFSPNNDGIDDLWEIKNIENFPDCKVFIFNIQGNKIYEAFPYQNNWDGTDQNGNQLSKGVYYYTIRCSDMNKNDKTGSITLLR